jgi:DMSO/TMAO reductase YedYZ molybdopterin-dependent catalytic subunit
MKKERGLRELLDNDPEKADAEIWGRESGSISRRGFVKKSALAAGSLFVGAHIPFFRNIPLGYIPTALAETKQNFVITGENGLQVFNDQQDHAKTLFQDIDESITGSHKQKGSLRILNNRPFNAEALPHLLDDDITPNHKHFVRNNGLLPSSSNSRDTALGTFFTTQDWTLKVDGEVHHPLTLSLEQLKRFKQHTLALTIECGGNGRAGFNPPAKGNQWTLGAVGCAQYTGVRLKDVLQEAGLKDTAFYTGYYGNDQHLSGDVNREAISRGTPIDKAMDENTLIAWEMNGQPLPALHGFPLRVITPGWPGSTSIKWLRRIYVRDREHDGAKMTGYSYRVPKYSVPPGARVPKKDMQIIESMPVKSLITKPKTQGFHPFGKPFLVRGHAWAGDHLVKDMDVSIDFGKTWLRANLGEPANRYAWQHWETKINFPMKGYYEVWARATDDQGIMQPMVVPGWNPKGYLNNAMHRIAVKVV